MFKKLATLLAAAVFTLSASSAFAAFTNFDLIQVVYQKSGGTTEVATDFGNVTSLINTTNNTLTPSLSSSILGLSNAYVTYYAVNTTTKELWITGGDTTKLGSLKTSVIGGVSGNTNIYYNSLGGTAGDTQVDAITTNANSFKVKSAGAGTFGGAITVNAEATERNLAELADGDITMDLYYFANYGVAGTGTKVATLSLSQDGITTVNPSAVPLPAAVYLFGSGLLGLVGLRRRINK